jgi:hypothetical protein
MWIWMNSDGDPDPYLWRTLLNSNFHDSFFVHIKNILNFCFLLKNVKWILNSHFAVALSIFDMLWGYIKGVFSHRFSFLGGHLHAWFLKKNWATLWNEKLKLTKSMSCNLFNERSWSIDYKSKVEINLCSIQLKK